MAILGKVLAYVFKNVGLLVGIVEAILKAIGAIISLTPSKKDDKIYAVIDKVFTTIKKWLYTISDKLAGKEATVPNS
jgi:phage-related minor tail protein